MYVHNFTHSHVGYCCFVLFFCFKWKRFQMRNKSFKFISDNSMIVIQRQFRFRPNC